MSVCSNNLIVKKRGGVSTYDNKIISTKRNMGKLAHHFIEGALASTPPLLPECEEISKCLTVRQL